SSATPTRARWTPRSPTGGSDHLEGGAVLVERDGNFEARRRWVAVPTGAVPRARGSSAGRGQAAHLRFAPRGPRRETRAAPAESLGLRHDDLGRRLDVERLGERLGRVPRRVDEELDAVALRVGEVDRPGIA